MASFKDMHGQEWTVSLNVGTISHIRAETGVDFTNPMERNAEGQTEIMRVARDPMLLVDVLFAACDEQVKERGLTPRQFAGVFDGDAIEAASLAIMEAICDYSPKRVRDAMHKARRKTLDRIQTATLSEDELDAIIDRAMVGPAA